MHKIGWALLPTLAIALLAGCFTPQYAWRKDPELGISGMQCQSEDPTACGNFWMSDATLNPGYHALEVKPGFYLIATKAEFRDFCRQVGDRPAGVAEDRIRHAAVRRGFCEGEADRLPADLVVATCERVQKARADGRTVDAWSEQIAREGQWDGTCS